MPQPRVLSGLVKPLLLQGMMLQVGEHAAGWRSATRTGERFNHWRQAVQLAPRGRRDCAQAHIVDAFISHVAGRLGTCARASVVSAPTAAAASMVGLISTLLQWRSKGRDKLAGGCRREPVVWRQ